MRRKPDLDRRLARLLGVHQALHDPQREPRNRLPWLPEVRRWQALRLEDSFDHFLRDPHKRPAAQFFLTEVYGDHDFSRRDADIVRVLPMMHRLLPDALLTTVADAIALGVLTHAFDLRMATKLQAMAPRQKALDGNVYAHAYRVTGLPRLRSRQIDLIVSVGNGLARSLRMPGVSTLLRLSRGPARSAGLAELQGFLERGYAAFSQLGDVGEFVGEIERDERMLSRRLFARERDPYRRR